MLQRSASDKHTSELKGQTCTNNFKVKHTHTLFDHCLDGTAVLSWSFTCWEA